MTVVMKTPIGDIPIIVTNALPPGLVVIAPPAPEPPSLGTTDRDAWMAYRAALEDWRAQIAVITNIGGSDALGTEPTSALLRTLQEGKGLERDV